MQPLFLPRSQIRQLGTFVSLPIYWSAKIKQFGQISFSILQHGNWKHGMIQIRLLDHPSKLSSYQNWYRHCLLREIWDLCICQSWAYLDLWYPIMKYETYWYRYPTVAPHGDGFSLGKTKNSRSVCLGPLAASLKLWSSVHHKFLKLQVDALKHRMCFHFARWLYCSSNNLVFMLQKQQYIQHI